MNPKIIIDLSKLESNIKFLTDKIKGKNLSITAVTKAHNADPRIVNLFEQFSEIEYFGDSRVENLKTYQVSSKKKIMIRIPMPSEVDDVVRYADISFNSELETLKLLNEAAKKQGKIHEVLLMMDLGDLREGFFDEGELLETVSEVVKSKNLRLIGLGTNLTCYGGVIPNYENLNRLAALKDKIETLHDLSLSMISGGNSSSLYLLEDGDEVLPKDVTNLRIGEAYLLGRETAFETEYENMYQDVFTISAEIVELKQKPSYPVGEIGIDAFGNKPSFVDKGIRLRGILAIGKQDIPVDSISPLDDKLEIVGASSDHLIVDFTDSGSDYHVGDAVSLKLEYGSLLATFTSKYVKKEYKGGRVNETTVPDTRCFARDATTP